MRRAWLKAGLLLLTLISTGCVYRRMTVLSDPPGARLFVNNVEVGTTPCNVPTNAFIDHGKYKFTLFKDGFEPLEVLEPVPAKHYEYPGIDFLAELAPWDYHDRRVFTYQMQPVREKSGDELKQQADEFRQRGGGGGLPPATPVMPGVAPVTPGAVTAPPPGTSAPPGRLAPVPANPSGPTIPLPPQ